MVISSGIVACATAVVTVAAATSDLLCFAESARARRLAIEPRQLPAKRAPSPALEWLERRIDEIRLRL